MSRSRRNGFTLIELVASALLAAMMMAALMSVVWSATGHSRHLRQDAAQQMPPQLVSQLRRDFQNARGMAVTSAGVSLYGYLDQDRHSGDATLLPGLVTYQRIRQDGRDVLVRRCEGVSGKKTEPAWIGFGGLQIDPLEQTDAEDALLNSLASGGLPPVPGRFRATILSSAGRVLWREVIHHHDH